MGLGANLCRMVVNNKTYCTWRRSNRVHPDHKGGEGSAIMLRNVLRTVEL
jgi:hypothetical protein